MNRLLAGGCVTALLGFAAPASAANTFVGPIQTYACASHTWANSLAAATAATTCTQPAVGDLANVAAGTVLGNATGSTAAPTATSTPVLGVASTTNGTLGLYSSGTAFAVTIQNTGATPGAYNFNLPLTAGSSGQALLSGGGGSTAMTWGNIVSSAFTVSSKTSSPYAIASAGADDWKRFDNSGAAGTQLFNMPTTANLAAGDNWCFLVATAQLLEIVANTGETITMANTTGSSAGNLQSNVVGSSVCIYMQSTTSAYVWASSGQWVLS